MLDFREAPAFRTMFHPEGAYRILKPETINGIRLERGDMLPKDSPLRRMPFRIQQMCQQNRMVPVLSDAAGGKLPPRSTTKTEAVTEEASAPQPTLETSSESPAEPAAAMTRVELMRLTMPELQALCKAKGINHVGNKSQLRKRLASTVAG